MIKFLKAIWNNDWSPYSLIEVVTGSHWHEYDKPYTDLFGTDYGELWETTRRTSFGYFIDCLPAIISLLFLCVYYPIMTIIWILLVFPIGFIKLVIDLFTKQWSDVF